MKIKTIKNRLIDWHRKVIERRITHLLKKCVSLNETAHRLKRATA